MSIEFLKHFRAKFNLSNHHVVLLENYRITITKIGKNDGQKISDKEETTSFLNNKNIFIRGKKC